MDELYSGSRIKIFSSPDVSITAIEASGRKIKTKEYGELIDFESGCWAAVLGHSHQEITRVITKNAGLLFHTHHYFDTIHPGALVKELVKAAKLNCSYRGSFATSGSEAVSLAVLLAEHITKRQMKLSFSISYLGASADLRMPRDSSKWIDLDIAQCLTCRDSLDCSLCTRFSHLNFSDIAALVFEPGNSGGLVIFPPNKLIRFLSQEIRSNGGYIIANEVTTGFGRTGKWFGFQHYEAFDSELTSPDFIAIGKGLGNGYPISGLLLRSNLAEIVESTSYRYLQSHTDDPLGCIVARKVVETISNEHLIDFGNRMGEYLRLKLSEISERIGGIKLIRGRGLMNVVVLEETFQAKEVFKSLLKEGFFTDYSEIHNLIRLYPSLTINSEEIDALCYSIQHILESHPH